MAHADIGICGGATILEYVNAGLVDDFSITLSPVLFGAAVRLFEGVDAGRVALEPLRAAPTQRLTQLTYAIGDRPARNFSSCVETQLGKNMAHVYARRSFGDNQPLTDLAVGWAVRNQRCDLQLARTQRCI